MNRTLKYKLDIPGIIALVISVIIMMISNLLLSSIWTEQIKEVYFGTYKGKLVKGNLPNNVTDLTLVNI